MEKREYWIKRAEQITDAQFKKSDDYLKNLEKQYLIAKNEIEKEIDTWYRRYSKNNGISFLDAKKELSRLELAELKWTLEEYIEYGQMNAINPIWLRELENASARVHITRLYSLQLQLQNHIEKLYAENAAGSYLLLKEIYEDSYYKSLFELQKGFNTGFKFMKFNENELDTILNKPWASDGVNFSNRLWKDKDKLINELQTNLTQCIIRGDNPNKVVNIMARKLETSKNNARRIIMTESAYFSNTSQNQCYRDLGVEEYEICSTLDNKTSIICRDMDGKVFKMSDYEVSVTAPPFHCHCRTCTVPYFDDEFTIGEKRAARAVDGKTYYVSSNINYSDWEKRYVRYGLSSNNNNDLFEHEAARLIGFSNTNDSDILDKYENEIVKDNEKENAIVLTDSGEIYHCYGVKDRVFPDVDLGEKLRNAIVTHNHPIDKTYYSFSENDIALFFDYNLKELRGIDEEYKYKIKRTKDTLNEEYQKVIHKFNTEYYYKAIEEALKNGYDMDIDAYHLIVSKFAEDYKFDYERVKL